MIPKILMLSDIGHLEDNCILKALYLNVLLGGRAWLDEASLGGDLEGCISFPSSYLLSASLHHGVSGSPPPHLPPSPVYPGAS